MEVTFWGVRGSIPCPLTQTQLRDMQRSLLAVLRQRGLPEPQEEERFLKELPGSDHKLIGGNTSCVEVSWSGQTLIFDAGSGLRLLGQKLMEGPCGRGQGRLRLFLSHTHWDHIQGLPYFAPIFIPGNRLEIYSGFNDIQERLSWQQQAEFFPVPLNQAGATITYHPLSLDEPLILAPEEGFPTRSRVFSQKLNHPGEAFGYRLEAAGNILIYAADSDYACMNHSDLDRYCAFFKNADLLIFDSQFSYPESLTRSDWGHASAILGVNIAHQAQVKKLALFHHSMEHSDRVLFDLCEQARAYKMLSYPEADFEVLIATEGLSVELGESSYEPAKLRCR
jgi:phosphoribosyl 1,2-cyclic phosphodiesterase